jgi:hypothetical protein
VIDGVEFYELDLFVEKLTLLMNLVEDNSIVVVGFEWEYPSISTTIEKLTDIYYEIDILFLKVLQNKTNFAILLKKV